MDIGQTNLQDRRQNEQAAAGVQAAVPYSIDQAVTIPTFYQTNHAAEWLKNNPQVTPPSESEIHGKMWESSMMMGLMVALATGNVQGGLAGGMWAAVAVHDHGYALRERSTYIDQLKADGYSFPAILKWYNEGDQSELDKERQSMLERDKLEENKREFGLNFQQKRDEFKATEQDKLLDRNQRAREFAAGQANQMSIAAMHERGADARARAANAVAASNADRADARLEKQQQQQLDSELSKSISGPQQKLQYAGMAEKAYNQLQSYKLTGQKDKIPGAFNNLLHALARVQVGGNASLTNEQIEAATGLLSYADKKTNDADILINGVPSDAWMVNVGQQIQDDKNNEMENITHLGHQAYEGLVGSGVDPVRAHQMVTRGLVGTAVGVRDWNEDEQPVQNAQQQNSSQYPAAPPIGTVEDGHKYRGGDPAKAESWEAV